MINTCKMPMKINFKMWIINCHCKYNHSNDVAKHLLHFGHLSTCCRFNSRPHETNRTQSAESDSRARAGLEPCRVQTSLTSARQEANSAGSVRGRRGRDQVFTAHGEDEERTLIPQERVADLGLGGKERRVEIQCSRRQQSQITDRDGH